VDFSYFLKCQSLVEVQNYCSFFRLINLSVVSQSSNQRESEKQVYATMMQIMCVLSVNQDKGLLMFNFPLDKWDPFFEMKNFENVPFTNLQK
jgi:hypothetical protein